MEFTIDPELEALLERTTATEDTAFENLLIEAGGPDESLKVWKEKGVLIDGHRRFAVCQKHGLPYKVEELSFPDKDAVKHWMRLRQRYRRNLSDFQRMQLDADIVKQLGSAAEVARQTGKAKSTVTRAVKTVEAVEKMRPMARKAIESGKVSVSRRAVESLEELPPVARKKAESLIANEKVESVTEAVNAVGVPIKEQNDNVQRKVVKAAAPLPESYVDSFGQEVPKPLWRVFKEVGMFMVLSNQLTKIAGEIKELGQRIGCDQTANLADDLESLRKTLMAHRPAKVKGSNWLNASFVGLDKEDGDD